MNEKRINGRREYTWVEGLAICLGMIGVQLSTQVINQWGTYFYSPPEGTGRTVYIPVALAGIIFIIGTIWDSITDPVIGMWSDRTNTRPGFLRIFPIRGRRRPFIFWGSFFMIFTSIFFWFPPFGQDDIRNFYYGTALLCLHWMVFTITVVPLTSLGPEIARSEKARVSLGIWTSIGMIVGLALAIVLPGEMITWLDPARAGGEFSAAGYRSVAAIFAIASFILLQIPVWFIRERYDSELYEGEHAAWRRGLTDAARNYPFVIYCLAFFFFNVGFLAAQNGLPYFAELGLGGDEGTVTLLMIPFVVTCILFYAVVPALTKRLHTKWMTFLAFLLITAGLPAMYIIAKADMETGTKILLGGMLFGWCGIAQSIMYVMMVPMLGEIIDYDELRSGQRREALYNGLHGLVLKIAIAGAILLSTQTMSRLGNSAANPDGVYLIGPFAGIFTFLGMIAILFYPIMDIARHPGGSKPLVEEDTGPHDAREENVSG
jgi:glycoside/pentoside/hexuronide:cation symporter, GPH family